MTKSLPPVDKNKNHQEVKVFYQLTCLNVASIPHTLVQDGQKVLIKWDYKGRNQKSPSATIKNCSALFNDIKNLKMSVSMMYDEAE